MLKEWFDSVPEPAPGKLQGYIKKLKYLLYLPEDSAAKKNWPLLIVLHGRGERGNVAKIKNNFLDEQISFIQKFTSHNNEHFAVVAPCCPDGTSWPLEVTALNLLLDHLLETSAFKIDERRVYLTGFSMGGYGTWVWSSCWPERFAAIAPICSGGGGYWLFDMDSKTPVSKLSQEKLRNLKDVPARAYHGDKDKTHGIEGSESLVNLLNKFGGKAELVIYRNKGHRIWRAVYKDSALYEWFLRHAVPPRRLSRPVTL